VIVDKCYFHPEKDSEKSCNYCRRPVCSTCLGKNNVCWACNFINYSKSEEKIIIDTVRKQKSNFFSKRLNYSIPNIWVGNWQDVKLFSLLGTQFLSLPMKDEEVEVFYMDPNKRYVSTIWTKEKNDIEYEKPTLLYSAWNIRYFDSFLMRLFKFLFIFLIPLILIGLLEIFIYPFVLKLLHIPNFLLSLIFVALFFVFMYLLFKLLLRRWYPNFWSPILSELEGEVETNLLENDGVLKWEVRKKDGTLINSGWKIFLRIRLKNNERKRILVEGIGEAPEFINNNGVWSFRIGENLNIEKGKTYRFKGRDLFNVLVCNLSLTGRHRGESFIKPVVNQK